MHEAMFYKTGKEGELLCGLCSHYCHINSGMRGICGVRENQNSKLCSLVYGRLVAESIDPIEKKPLFQFLPSYSQVWCLRNQ